MALNFDDYRNKVPYKARRQDPEANQAFRDETARLNRKFKADALEAVGLFSPKADKAFALAWEYGHANGLEDVFSHLQDLADLLLVD